MKEHDFQNNIENILASIVSNKYTKKIFSHSEFNKTIYVIMNGDGQVSRVETYLAGFKIQVLDLPWPCGRLYFYEFRRPVVV